MLFPKTYVYEERKLIIPIVPTDTYHTLPLSDQHSWPHTDTYLIGYLLLRI